MKKKVFLAMALLGIAFLFPLMNHGPVEQEEIGTELPTLAANQEPVQESSEITLWRDPKYFPEGRFVVLKDFKVVRIYD